MVKSPKVGTIKEGPVDVTQVNGTLGILAKVFLQLQAVWILMNYSGNLIGPAADAVGKKRVAS